MSAHCPQCQRVIYSRRHKQCGFCGAALPVEMLLTPAELAAMDQADAKLKAELDLLKKAREQAEREAQAAMSAASAVAVAAVTGAGAGG